MCERASKKRMEEKDKLSKKKEDNKEVAAAATTIAEMKTGNLENNSAKDVNRGTHCANLDHVLFATKPAAKVVMTDQEKKKLNKKLSRQRTVSRSGAKLNCTLRNTEYGEYLEITDIPYHIMGNLVMFFKEFAFDTKYDKHCGTITSGNEIYDAKNKTHDNSTYWMIDRSKQAVMYASWELNPNLSKLEKDILNHMKDLIIEAVKGAIGDDNVYEYYVPGFVKTGNPRHQMLHLDSSSIDFEFPWTSLIVHIPLEEKGQWLRLGKVVPDDNDEQVEEDNPSARTRRGKKKKKNLDFN